MSAEAQSLDRVRHPDAYDPGGKQAGDTGEELYEGLDLVDATNDLALLARTVGIVFGEEELLVLVAGELPTIGEEANEESGKDSPDNEQGWYGGEGGGESHTG